MPTITIKHDDLSGEDIAVFLQEHLDDMRATSPPESKHALDLDSLRQSDVKFWTVWEAKRLVGCGALKHLSSQQCEIKSMRVSSMQRGKGIASQLLQFILQQAADAGYQEVLLETGSMDFFKAARHLYSKHGFEYCEPFGDYKLDPNSVFMRLALG